MGDLGPGRGVCESVNRIRSRNDVGDGEPGMVFDRNAPINPFAQSIDRDASTFAAGPAMMSINDVRYDYSLSGNFLASARGVSSSGDVPPACSRSTTWVR